MLKLFLSPDLVSTVDGEGKDVSDDIPEPGDDALSSR